MSEFIDPFGIQDIYCNDLAYLQIAGPGLIRFVLFAEDGYPSEKVVRAKILLPCSVVPGAILKTTSFLAGNLVPIAERLLMMN